VHICKQSCVTTVEIRRHITIVRACRCNIADYSSNHHSMADCMHKPMLQKYGDNTCSHETIDTESTVAVIQSDNVSKVTSVKYLCIVCRIPEGTEVLPHGIGHQHS
jgi:hypothetical protein